jgi:tetratricopeptide (TPR) repeat protein
LTSLFLITATLAAYWQVCNHEFVNFDDDLYVTENRHVQAGLTPEGVRWAFSFETGIAYWHPLTWLSLMLDYDLYGLNPGGYHLTNLLVHILSTLLLFSALKRMTGAHWQSAFVAALFSLHPLNVNSIAWVAARKNVLSTFFWMLTMWTYARYAERARPDRYLLVLLPFALGLMAKPMLVTLPFVLLLLDWWPLGRIHFGQATKQAGLQTQKPVSPGNKGSLVFRLVLEKAPLIALSAVSVCLSSLSVQPPGVPLSIDSVPMTLRIANALVSYAGYIGKMIWPDNLAVFYPPPPLVPTWQAASAALFLALASVLVLRVTTSRPYFAVGWLWYVGTLVPVIGLVRVGLWPAMADRFAYVPLIGVFIVVAWAVPDLLTRWRYRKMILPILAASLLSVLMVLTWFQVGYWHDDTTLFQHAVDVTDNNYVAMNNLGNALKLKGKIDEAIAHYSRAVRTNPAYAQAHFNLAVTLEGQGKVERSIVHYTKAVRAKPDYAQAHYYLAKALEGQGKVEQFLVHYTKAVRAKPDYAQAHNDLGVALAKLGRFNRAVGHLSDALRIDPDFAEAHNNLGLALTAQENPQEAISHYREALRINPQYADAHHNLGIVLAGQGGLQQAVDHYSEALRINPDLAEAYNDLGIALARQGKLDEAIARFSEALRLKPDFSLARDNLGLALEKAGKAPGG